MLESDFVVRLLDVFAQGLGFVLVFEFMVSDLSEMIHNIEDPLKENQVKRYIQMLLQGVAYLHSQSIMHRDLKPANLFLMPNGEIKVIDFGESKDLFVDDDDGGNAATATIRGTPQYLSPLLWKAHVVDGNSSNIMLLAETIEKQI